MSLPLLRSIGCITARRGLTWGSAEGLNTPTWAFDLGGGGKAATGKIGAIKFKMLPGKRPVRDSSTFGHVPNQMHAVFSGVCHVGNTRQVLFQTSRQKSSRNGRGNWRDSLRGRLGLDTSQGSFPHLSQFVRGLQSSFARRPRGPAGAFQIRHSTPNMRRAPAPCLD